jgi:hypothetical protein
MLNEHTVFTLQGVGEGRWSTWLHYVSLKVILIALFWMKLIANWYWLSKLMHVWMKIYCKSPIHIPYPKQNSRKTLRYKNHYIIIDYQIEQEQKSYSAIHCNKRVRANFVSFTSIKVSAYNSMWILWMLLRVPLVSIINGRSAYQKDNKSV